MNTSLHEYLLTAITQKLPAHISLVEILQEILDISQASAYRRVSKQASFSLDELVKLSRHFHISIDRFLDIRTENVIFQYHQFTDVASFKRYLQHILARLRQISQNPQSKIISADDDLPILQHFRYPEHTAFKIYYWLLSTYPPNSQKPRFSPAWIEDELLALTQEIYELYTQTPIIEIWTQDCANTTLKQIEYCVEMDLFESSTDTEVVKQQFLDMFVYLENQAAVNPHFQLYLSEVQIDNNCIWTQTDEGQEVYIRHQFFNVVHTDAQNFCADTHKFLDTLTQKSLLLSGTAEKQRIHFFENIKSKII